MWRTWGCRLNPDLAQFERAQKRVFQSGLGVDGFEHAHAVYPRIDDRQRLNGLIIERVLNHGAGGQF